MNELALFAGAGGGILGGKLLGWRTVCAVEWDAYAASVLMARQNDGSLPPFPIWDDVQTFDGRPWRGRVDVISVGFPCQDISAAGKGAGIDGERSGMWTHMARIVGEVRPRFVFVENSPMLTLRGLDRVLGDLSTLGFDARWGVVGAIDAGAPHRRDRIWIVANANGTRQRASSRTRKSSQSPQAGNNSRRSSANVANSMCERSAAGFTNQKGWEKGNTGESVNCCSDVAAAENTRDVWRNWELGTTEKEYHHRGSQTNGGRQWWAIEPALGRVAHGVANRVDRLKAIGNGQVPIVAARAWRILSIK